MAIITGLAAAYSHSQNGMTMPDLQACMRVADRLDEVIIFRSTGPWSKRWLERGYPSKNFHVKGKSSDWGPHAGLVPYDGRYSKVGYSAAKAAKGTEQNIHGLGSGFAIKQPLVLTRDQIEEQCRRTEGDPPRTAINEKIEVSGSRDLILIATRSGDAVRVRFRAIHQANGSYQIWVYENASANIFRLLDARPDFALEVMASAEVGGQEPMTGDYDLLAVSPTWAQYGSRAGRDIVKPGIQLAGRLMSGLAYRAGVGMDNVLNPDLHTMSRRTTTLTTTALHQEHPDMGNLTPRILRCINELNVAMGAGGANTALRRVHHNAESHRNAMFGALTENDMLTKKDGEKFGDGFPFTVFQPARLKRLPSTLRYTDVCTIETLDEFRLYAADLARAGFYVPRNWAWNVQPQYNISG